MPNKCRTLCMLGFHKWFYKNVNPEMPPTRLPIPGNLRMCKYCEVEQEAVVDFKSAWWRWK